MNDTAVVGTAGFVHCKATITAHFPIGWDGKAHACCDQCFYYRQSSNRCGITMQPCFEAKKYVGNDCPFRADLENYFLGGKNNG